MKGWKRCFVHLLECSLLNVYVLAGLALQISTHNGVIKEGLPFFSCLKLAAGQVAPDNKQLAIPKVHKPSGPNQSWISRANQRKIDSVCCLCHHMKAPLECCYERHETMIMCSTCEVHLCIDEERQCYIKCHTLTEFC